MRKFEIINKFGLTGKAMNSAAKIALDTNIGVCMYAENICITAEELSDYFESRKLSYCKQAADELLKLAEEVRNFSPNDDESFVELAIDIQKNINPSLSNEDFKNRKVWSARIIILNFMLGIIDQLTQMRCV